MDFHFSLTSNIHKDIIIPLGKFRKVDEDARRMQMDFFAQNLVTIDGTYEKITIFKKLDGQLFINV